MHVRVVVVAMLLLAGCAAVPEAPREPCPEEGVVRSNSLDPVASTDLPPGRAVRALAEAFDVVPPQSGPTVRQHPQGETWSWTGEGREAWVLVVAGRAMETALRVEGSRFQHPTEAASAVAQAAEAFGLPGEAAFDDGAHVWDTGIEAGGGVALQVGNSTTYRLRPAFVPPANLLPPSTFASEPPRAVACLLAEAGAFMASSRAVLVDERLELDEERRLERLFVYNVAEAHCGQREVHVRFDALWGGLLGTHLLPCAA